MRPENSPTGKREDARSEIKMSGAEITSMALMKAAESLRGVKVNDKGLSVTLMRYSLNMGFLVLLTLKL